MILIYGEGYLFTDIKCCGSKENVFLIVTLYVSVLHV